ncbi:Ribonuclease H-like domain [Phytophthora cactorum]|nr:Ribonuclease H-like domain [Phytophthora cactorum]
MRAWIGADLAVPDLRTELIAMTGSTVARWALLGTHGPHIVQIRDVLHWCGDDRGRLECGSGSVVLRVGSDLASLDLCWVGSMSYGSPRMINNTAELLDLLMGLRACMGHGWMPLHVVGDSNLFLRQQRLRIPPKATHLRGLYYQSQMTADQLIVFSWQNHYREVNKMADILANMLRVVMVPPVDGHQRLNMQRMTSVIGCQGTRMRTSRGSLPLHRTCRGRLRGF